MISYLKRYPYLSWIIVGGLFFLPNLGASHLFDWDEINFAESAREIPTIPMGTQHGISNKGPSCSNFRIRSM